MAKDVIRLAIDKFGLPDRKCATKELKLQGHDQPVINFEIESLSNEELRLLIKRSVAEEMCMTVEDFLSRRTRQLLLDAQIAINSASLIAKLLAEELNKDEAWIQQQINNFNLVASNYKPATTN
jgi:glycerol-3-phosphate dehydrogenase